MFDNKCRDAIDKNASMMVPWYLMAIVAYEEQNDPIISDALFDEIGYRLRKEWSFLRHWHMPILRAAMEDPTNTKPSSLDADPALLEGIVKTRILGGLQSLRKITPAQATLL